MFVGYGMFDIKVRLDFSHETARETDKKCWY